MLATISVQISNGENLWDLVIIAHCGEPTMTQSNDEYTLNDHLLKQTHLHKQTIDYTKQIVWIIK